MVCVDMKEHKIETLCQMEYEDWRRTNPMDWGKNDIKGKLSDMKNMAQQQANIYPITGAGGALGRMLNGLFGYQGSLLNVASRCPNCGSNFRL